jgi:hypothetical protein
MCYGTEAAWIPAVIAAAGAGTSAYTADNARKQQDQEASAGIMRQAQFQRQADAKVGQTVQQISQSNPDEDKKLAERDYLAALQRNKQATTGALNPVAGASDRYAEDLSSATATGATNTAGLVKNQAAVDAPTFQRLRESNAAGDLASQLGLINGASGGADALMRSRIVSIRANPWLTGLGSGLQATGGALAGADWKKKLPKNPGQTPGYGDGIGDNPDIGFGGH